MTTKSSEFNYYTSELLQRKNVDLTGFRLGNNHEGGFAARMFSQCLADFRNVCVRNQENAGPGGINSALWSELARLYLWGEHFEDGRLEMALHQSDEIGLKVISLLLSMGKALLTLISKLASLHKTVATDVESSSELAYLIEQAEIIINNTDDLAQTQEDEADQSDLDSEFASDEEESLLEDVQFYTRCLMHLVPALQTNLDRSTNINTQRLLSPPEAFYVSNPAEFYVSSVRDKFPKADLSLVQRLGERNWQRHERIRDRINKSEEGIDRESTSVKALSATRSVFQSSSAFHDSGLGTSIPATSQYADSAVSHTSFVSIVDDGANKSLRVPPTPSEVARGKPFICSICGKMQAKIRNRIEWKMHVFADLQPYICTFPSCDYGLIQFSTRATWADHEFAKHRFEERWKCAECAFEAENPEGWEHHIEHVHSLRFSGSDMMVAIDRARISKTRPIETEECLLCKTTPARNRRAFEKHVGHHMEEIALLAFPRDIEDNSEGLSNVSDEDIIAGSPPSLSRDSEIKMLNVIAGKATEIADALAKFLDALPKSKIDITALIAQCFNISSVLLRLAEAVKDTRRLAAYAKISDYVHNTVYSLEYTFKDFRQIVGEWFADAKKANFPPTAYHRVWETIVDYFQQESGNSLDRRLEYCRLLLLDLIDILHEGSPRDLASFHDLVTRVSRLLEVQEARVLNAIDLYEEHASSNIGGPVPLTASDDSSSEEENIKSGEDPSVNTDNEDWKGQKNEKIIGAD